MGNEQTAGKLAPRTSDEDLSYIYDMLRELRAKAAQHDFTLAYLVEMAAAHASDILFANTPLNQNPPSKQLNPVKSSCGS